MNIFSKSEILEKDDFPDIEVKSRYPDYNNSRSKTKRVIIKELFDPSHYDPDTRPGEGMIAMVVWEHKGRVRKMPSRLWYSSSTKDFGKPPLPLP